MTYPKYINPAFRQPKPFFRQMRETMLFFGHKQFFGAFPLLGFMGLLTSGIWLNNLRYQHNYYYSMKADGSALAGGGH